MPAQKRITHDMIVKSAFEILQTSGIEAVNARSISKKLGCSTQPIYHSFQGMDELKAELISEASKRHLSEVHKYMEASKYPLYMAYGIGLVFFAQKEKQLFRFLYMVDQGESGLYRMDINLQSILETICREYHYTLETAKVLHTDMTIYTYGLALCMSTRTLNMTEKEIADRLSTEFMALTGIYSRSN